MGRSIVRHLAWNAIPLRSRELNRTTAPGGVFSFDGPVRRRRGGRRRPTAPASGPARTRRNAHERRRGVRPAYDGRGAAQRLRTRPPTPASLPPADGVASSPGPPPARGARFLPRTPWPPRQSNGTSRCSATKTGLFLQLNHGNCRSRPPVHYYRHHVYYYSYKFHDLISKITLIALFHCEVKQLVCMSYFLIESF